MTINDADRKAAANAFDDECFLRPSCDNSVATQAFARHRLAERERIVQYLWKHGADGKPFNLDDMASLGLVLDVAASNIRAGDHEAPAV